MTDVVTIAKPLEKRDLDGLATAIRESTTDAAEPPDVPLDIPLNENIRLTVMFLQTAGFVTVDSGDGKTHACECDRDYAYVSIKVRAHNMLSEADRLCALLKAHGIDIYELRSKDYAEDDIPPCIQATYDPGDGSANIDLMYFDDDYLKNVFFPK
jgi:hypothetical protein